MLDAGTVMNTAGRTTSAPQIKEKCIPTKSNMVPGANASVCTYHLFILHSFSTPDIRCRDFKVTKTLNRDPRWLRSSCSGLCRTDSLKLTKGASGETGWFGTWHRNYGGWAWATLRCQKARKCSEITVGLSKRQGSWLVKAPTGYLWGNWISKNKKIKICFHLYGGLESSKTAKLNQWLLLGHGGREHLGRGPGSFLGWWSWSTSW